MVFGLFSRRRGSPRGGGGSSSSVPLWASRVFRRAEEALSRVTVPGFDVDLVSSGIVRRMRLARDGVLIVFLDYYGSDPGCFFCRFINDTLWASMLERAAGALREAGVEVFELRDYSTGLLLWPRGEHVR